MNKQTLKNTEKHRTKKREKQQKTSNKQTNSEKLRPSKQVKQKAKQAKTSKTSEKKTKLRGVMKAAENHRLSKAMTCKGPLTDQETERSYCGSPPLVGEAVFAP